ncbi:hypothetical protein LCGC14_1355180 [marine sediment metagenome]|uniref:Uncharacterized protein n=1 Tax=marine sediment metagenome TaxID=412755 RepID=A0A0F9K9N7_9ZZZZ|nr:hypothetical protein [Candidatus Aminicenantes bacterium]
MKDIREQIAKDLNQPNSQFMWNGKGISANEMADIVINLPNIKEGLKRLEVESQCTLCTPDRFLDVPTLPEVEVKCGGCLGCKKQVIEEARKNGTFEKYDLLVPKYPMSDECNGFRLIKKRIQWKDVDWSRIGEIWK